MFLENTGLVNVTLENKFNMKLLKVKFLKPFCLLCSDEDV